MYVQDQSPQRNSHIANQSSDEEFENEKTISPQKSTNQNEDVIDEKEEVRQVPLKVENEIKEILHELIKEEQLEDIETKYEESEIESEKQIQSDVNEIVVESMAQKIESNSQLSIQQITQSPTQLSLKKDEKSPSIAKPLAKSYLQTSTSSKYLQPNSPQLFISPQSLLPNQIICIQNNSTRVIVHMNKKIVPIPSSFVKDPKIKSSSPQKSYVTLPSVQYPYLLGKMIVTNYKLIYMDSLYPNTMTFSLPLNYLYKIQRTTEQSSGVSHIEMWFKTGLSVKFKYHQEEYNYSQKIKDILLTLMHKNFYAAMDLGQQENLSPFLCKSYSQKYFNEEKTRTEVKGIEAEIIENINWEEMPSYPEKYVVPLRYIGKRNTQTRFVVLSYVYPVQNQKITLWRTGPGNPDPSEEEWITKAKFSNKHFIIEVKNKGIGISKAQGSRLIEIENLYLLRESFQKIHQLFYHNHDSIKWLGNLCTTKWYEQVTTLMNEALHVIEVMSQKSSVTLVCDTEGRGAQITAIVQLLINPFHRTFEGFPQLIEKQFLHFGCPKPGKKQRQEDKSIILIQFLDCVYQFTHLYPLSFEFSEHYLVYLAEHVFSNKYGNFLFLTRQLKKESDRRQVVEKCVCIWQDIRRKMENDKKSFFEQEEMKKPLSLTKKSSKKLSISPPIHQSVNYYIFFRNSFYIDHNESNIFELRNHSQVSKGIKLWSSYFSKKVYCAEQIKEQVLFCNQIEKRYFKIAYEHILMKKYNQNMRKKLSEQYAKIAEKKQIIKSLKDL